MYLVGQIVRAHGTTEAPQWDVVAFRRTRAGAVKDCDEDQKRFFIKLKFGKLPEGAEPIFPRRP